MKAQLYFFRSIVLILIATAMSCRAQTTEEERYGICAVVERLDRQTALTATYEELPVYTVSETKKTLDTAITTRLFKAVTDELKQNRTHRVKTKRSNLLTPGYNPALRITFYLTARDTPVNPVHGKKIFTVYADTESDLFHIVSHEKKRTTETPIIKSGDKRLSILIKKDICRQTATKDTPYGGTTAQEQKADTENGRMIEAISRMKVKAAYLLDPMQKNAVKRIGPFAVIDSLTTVSDELGGKITSLLSSYGTYEQTDMVSDCTFLPDVAWTVTDGTRTFYVTVAFYCGELIIDDGANTVRLRFSVEEQNLLRCAMSCFPNDDYLKKYIIK